MQVGQCRQVSAGRSVRSVSLYIYTVLYGLVTVGGGADLTQSARYAIIGIDPPLFTVVSNQSKGE